MRNHTTLSGCHASEWPWGRRGVLSRCRTRAWNTKKSRQTRCFPEDCRLRTGRSYAIDRHPSMAVWMTQAFQSNGNHMKTSRNRTPISQILHNDSATWIGMVELAYGVWAKAGFRCELPGVTQHSQCTTQNLQTHICTLRFMPRRGGAGSTAAPDVALEPALLPIGWETRLVPVASPDS